MAVNKNFVVKNGLEVNTNLIVADTDSQKVGIGTTISSYLLHVYQGTGIGASSVYVTGISTVAQTFNVGLGGSVFTVLGNAEGTAGIGQSVGVGTGEPAYLLDVRSPVSTGQTALYVQGDMRVTGDLNLDDLNLDQLQVSGISSFIGFSTFASGITVLGLGATTTTLDVTGVSTFRGTVGVLNSVEITGITSIQNTEQSSSKTTGALVVEGGVGIEKNLFVGGGAEITGISTLTGTVDINNSVEISGITTVQNTTDSDSKDTGALVVEGGVGIEKNLKVGAGLSVVGFSTFADTVQIQSLTDNRVAIVGAGSTIEDDGNLTFDGGQLEVGVGLSVAGLSTFVGVGTFISDLYVGGDLYISENVSLDTNLNILGIATIGTLDITNYSDFGLGIDVAGYGVTSTTLNVTGVSTLGGTVDINNSVEIAGITTIQDTTDSDSKDTGALVVEGGVGIEKNLRVGAGLSVAGLSTFIGVGTFISDLYVGGDLYIADDITLDTNLNILGIATIGTLDVTNYSTLGLGLDVAGAGSTTTTLTVSGVSTFTGSIDANGDVDIDGHTELDDVNVSGASTFTGAADFNGDIDVDGHTELDNLNVAGFSTFASFVDVNASVDISDNLNVSGITTTQSLVVTSSFDVFDADATFHGDVTIDGNLSIGGTATVINAAQLRVEDKDIVLGFTTTQDPNDDTANHGGIAVASTEGSPLVSLDVVGINTLPDTYKQIMWVKNGTMGAGTTDAWLFNYAVGIGSTIVPNGVRLAVESIQFTGDTITSPQLIVSGVTTSNSYTIDGTTVINSSRELQNIASLDATTTATIESAIANAPNTFTDLRVSGVSTFIGIATFASGVSVLGLGVTTTTLDVTGVSTFTGNVDINAQVDISTDILVGGAATVTGTTDLNGDLDVDGHTELDNLNVAGFSTFVGFATFSDYVFIQDGLNVTGVVTATSFSGDGSSLTGTATGLNAAVGVSSEGTFIGAGATIINFASTSGGAMNVTVSGGIATATVTPGVSIGLAIALGG